MPDQIPVTGTPSSQAADESAARASTTAQAKALAHTIAEKLLDPNAPVTPVTPTTPAQKFTTEPVGQETPVVQPLETAPVGEEAVEEVAPVAPDIAELERIITEAAFDLGIHPADVPAEMLPVYEKLVQAAVEVRQAADQERLQAAEAIEQVQEFAKQLQEHPDRLLLTLAVNNAEAFKQAVEVYNEMQENPRVRDLVLRELSAEARLREAERREKVFENDTQVTKAQRVVNATKIAVRKHNVPYEVAEKVVAAAITMKQGDFGPGDVESVVTELAANLKGQGAGRKTAARVATPAKVAAAAKAPTGEVGGSTPAAPAASAGLTQATPHGRLKSIIQGAFGRLRQVNQ